MVSGFAMPHTTNSKQLTDALHQAMAVECLRGSDRGSDHFAPKAGRSVSFRISRTLGNPEWGT
jgi:hypothetical protein